MFLRVCTLTDDAHPSQVKADLGEAGEARGGVVSPTVTVFSSGAVGWALRGVVEPEKEKKLSSRL